MPFEHDEAKKRATRAVLDEVFPLPQADAPTLVENLAEPLPVGLRQLLVEASIGGKVRVIPADPIDFGALLDDVPLTDEDALIDLEACFGCIFGDDPVQEAPFPSRMEGIATDDPLYCLTELVPAGV